MNVRGLPTSGPLGTRPEARGPVVELREEAPGGRKGRSLHRLAQQEPDDYLRHRRAWDGMQTRGSGPRGAAGTDCGDTRTLTKHTHTHTLLPTLSALKTSLSPKEADSALCQRGRKKKGRGEKNFNYVESFSVNLCLAALSAQARPHTHGHTRRCTNTHQRGSG